MQGDSLESIIVLIASVFVTVTVVVVLIVMNRYRNKFVEMTPEETLKMKPHICPKCGFNMTPGFAFTQRGLYWRLPDMKPMGALMTRGKLVNNTYNMGFVGAENRSWRCDRCQLLLLDIGEMVRVRKRK